METTNPTDETPEPTADLPPEPALPPERSFPEIKAYNQAKRVVHITDIVISLAYWAVWCGLAGGFVAWLGGDGGGSRWLTLLGATLVMLGGSTLLMLPLSYYSGYILEQRFGLSNQTRMAWLVFQTKGWLVGGIIGGIVLAGLYAALWYAGTFWSVWVWAGVMSLSILLAKVFPLIILPLFYPSEPLDRPTLADRLTELAGGAGMTITGIFNLQMSKETKKANAMLAGLGSSRRVYLSDTLLEAFDDDQIAVVFAHELGHHIRRHIWKSIGLAAVMSSMTVGLIHWRLNPTAGTDSTAWAAAIAAFSQVMLIVNVFPLFIGPITNAISRHFERQCDGDALRLTGKPDAYRGAFELLARLNLEDPTPPRWEVILFDDHPPLAERIAMADEQPGSQRV